MKTTNKEYQKGSAVIETIIVIVIIIIIIALFVQKKKPASYYLNEAKKTTTQENVIEPSTTTSTTTTTTTTIQSGGGSVTYTNMPPTITLYGDNPYQIFHPGIYPDCQYPDRCPPRTDFYSEPGFKATDREDGDITSKVKVTDEFSNSSNTMNPCRTYNKKYTVTDSNGATSIARRAVNECNGM